MIYKMFRNMFSVNAGLNESFNTLAKRIINLLYLLAILAPKTNAIDHPCRLIQIIERFDMHLDGK